MGGAKESLIKGRMMLSVRKCLPFVGNLKRRPRLDNGGTRKKKPRERARSGGSRNGWPSDWKHYKCYPRRATYSKVDYECKFLQEEDHQMLKCSCLY